MTATCRASPSAAARTMRSARTAQQVAFSVRAVPVGEPWSTNFDIYHRRRRRRHAAQSHRRQSRPGTGSPPSRPTARSSPTWRWIGPGFESDRFHLVLLDLQSRRQASAHPELGPIDRQLRLVARRQDACSRPPIIWASIRCGRSMPRPAGPRPSPAHGEVEGFSVGTARGVLHRSATWRVPPICIRSDSAAASPRSSPT